MAVRIKLTNQKHVTALYASMGTLGLVRSLDGGASWSAPLRGGGADDYAWISPSVGLKAEGSGVSLTTDGGQNWTTVQAGFFTEVAMYDAMHGYAVGAPALIYVTDDGGHTWTSVGGAGLGIGTTSLDGVACVPGFPKVAYVCGSRYGGVGVILKTTDGGATWTAQASGAAVDLASIAADPDGLRATVGSRYTADGGANWQAATGVVGQAGPVVWVAPGVFACGTTPTGKVYRSIDGGANWVAVTDDIGGGVGITGLAFNGNQGWASSPSVLAMTTDGGQTWTNLAPPGPLYELSCAGVGYLQVGPALVLDAG